MALVLTLVVKDDGDGGTEADKPGASAGTSQTGDAPSGGTSPSEEASPSDPATGVPDGYESYEDPEGFTIARPVGWTRQTSPSQYGFEIVDYFSPDGYSRLQVYEVEESSPKASFDKFLSDVTPTFNGFEKEPLEQLTEGEVTGMRLEYRVDSIRGEPGAGGWHVQDIRFRSPHDDKLYAINAYGAPTDGTDPELDLALTALAHFCPPDSYCG